MERENIGRGQPDKDSLVEFNILGNDCLDDRANPCSKWLDKNILKEDGHPVDYITQAVREVGIDVKSVMKEFKMSSSLEFGHRQLHHDDPTSHVEFSHESGSSSSGGDGVDDEKDGNGGDN